MLRSQVSAAEDTAIQTPYGALSFVLSTCMSFVADVNSFKRKKEMRTCWPPAKAWDVRHAEECKLE